jgi:hypothetical protein
VPSNKETGRGGRLAQPTEEKIHVRLKKLTCGAAVLGMSAGLFALSGATAANAANTTIRPYIGFNPGTAIGQTDAGVWDSETCFIAVDNAHPGNNGKINNVIVAGHAGELNVNYTDETAANVNSCDTVDIDLSGTLGQTNAVAPKHGGSVNVTTTAQVQGGISASSVTTLDVTLSAGQVLKNPTTTPPLSGSLTGPGTVRVKLKASSVKTKPVAASPASCEDQIYTIDTTAHDSKGAPIATVWDGATIPPATSYFATIRTCAGSAANVAGKPVTTKLSVTGAGTVGVQIYEAQTVNPATWDQTQGTCSAAKTVATGTPTPPHFGSTAGDASRVLQCKGNYGVSIPFSLDVRPFSTNSGQDPNGLIHAAELNLGSVSLP